MAEAALMAQIVKVCSCCFIRLCCWLSLPLMVQMCQVVQAFGLHVHHRICCASSPDLSKELGAWRLLHIAESAGSDRNCRQALTCCLSASMLRHRLTKRSDISHSCWPACTVKGHSSCETAVMTVGHCCQACTGHFSVQRDFVAHFCSSQFSHRLSRSWVLVAQTKNQRCDRSLALYSASPLHNMCLKSAAGLLPSR